MNMDPRGSKWTGLLKHPSTLRDASERGNQLRTGILGHIDPSLPTALQMD